MATLDSLPKEAQAWLEAEEVTVFVYPHDKNETDLELALLHAVAHYEDDIQIFGALGGRLDQTLANIMLLAHPALVDRHVELLTEHQRAWLLTEQAEISGASWRPGLACPDRWGCPGTRDNRPALAARR